MKLFRIIVVSIISSCIMFILLEQFIRYIERPLFDAPGELVNIEGEKIHVYTEGSGENTIVLLSGFEAPSPYIQYLPLIRELSKDYKVVLIEYFGYGFSDETNRKRSNENIIEEIRTCLKDLNIKPPYVLMPHSMSNVYSKYYASKYPKEIEAIISLDGSSTSFMAETTMDKKLNEMKEKEYLKTVGLHRVDWHLNYKRSLRNYSDEEIKSLKYFVNHNMANKTLQNEAKMVVENAKEVSNMECFKDLPILRILASETVENYKKQNFDWIKMQNEDSKEIKNIEIIVLDGTHSMIHRQKTKKIVEITKDFLNKKSLLFLKCIN